MAEKQVRRPGVDATDAADFASRLKEAIGSQSIRAFSEKAGISSTAIRNYLSGSSDPSRTALNLIAEATGTNLKWLATGEGPSKRPAPSKEAHADDAIDAITDISNFTSEYVFIPRFTDVGGGTAIGEQRGWMSFRRDYILKITGSKHFFLFYDYAKSDNMEPTIKKGDLFLVDMHDNDIKHDGIYYVNIGVFPSLKRISYLVGDEIVIKNDDSVYPETITINRSDPKFPEVVGRVVWFGRGL